MLRKASLILDCHPALRVRNADYQVIRAIQLVKVLWTFGYAVDRQRGSHIVVPAVSAAGRSRPDHPEINPAMLSREPPSTCSSISSGRLSEVGGTQIRATREYMLSLRCYNRRFPEVFVFTSQCLTYHLGESRFASALCIVDDQHKILR
jgi:hypothetical protein